MAPHALSADTPSITKSSLQDGVNRPLKVLVIGAGIAGLSAAVGLRRAGHEVEVLSPWRGE